MPVAIVTGGNSGIGRACAAALARSGFDVGLTWHEDEANLAEVVAELEEHGVRVAHRQADFSRVPGADAVIDQLAEELGGVDAFVANAAAGDSTRFLETDVETFQRVIALTLTGPFQCGQRAARRAPGEIATKMTGNEDVDPRGERRAGIPAGRPGDANEIATVVAMLCSPEAGYVTGASYVVDGGMLLMAATANQLAQ